jgi:hypothetical protein
VDSGCTDHFLLVNVPCLNKVESRTPLTVRLPNGATMESSHTADLDIPELNAAASKAHVFPGMAHHSLLSVGQLCDEGYIVTFKQDTVTICNSESSKLLSGPRDVNTGLWWTNLKQTNKHIYDPIANNVYELRNTGALVHYLHKALFSPTKSALLQAVKDGHLITWPGLMEDAINKHLKLTPATAMGHMNQRRYNIRSTSKAPTATGYRLGHKDPHRVRSRSRSRSTLHRLDGKVPSAIQQRKLLCDGLLHLLFQLH